MFKLGFRSLLCAFSLACASAPLLTGCANVDRGEAVEDGGAIDLALETTGADGAVYGFPIGTYLSAVTATSSEWIPLWGSEAVLSKTLPVGAYSVSLYFENDDVRLTRDDGTAVSEVSAAWTNQQPVTFTIAQGQTTPLALHFSVETLVDVVFDTGTLQVITDVVTVDTEQPGSARISGTTSLLEESYGDTTAPYATALDVDLGVDSAFAIGFQSTGDWQQLSSTMICQSGTISDASSPGSVGLDLRMAQFVGGVASLCVFENGASDQLSLYPSNYAAPPAGQETFLPDTQYGFYGGFSVLIGDVYDGTTLKQTELENVALVSGYFYHQIYDSASQFISMVQGNVNGTFQLRP